jgi:hypothetical protein
VRFVLQHHYELSPRIADNPLDLDRKAARDHTLEIDELLFVPELALAKAQNDFVGLAVHPGGEIVLRVANGRRRFELEGEWIFAGLRKADVQDGGSGRDFGVGGFPMAGCGTIIPTVSAGFAGTTGMKPRAERSSNSFARGEPDWATARHGT